MPKGMPTDPHHLAAAEAIREAALVLVRLIAQQAVRDGDTSFIEVTQDAKTPEGRR